jgi:hypothetical protein
MARRTPRRTPPIRVQVIPPLFPSIALMQARLIDFDTGSGELEEQHETWLRNSMNRAKPNSSFHIRVFGYASHLGTGQVNNQVSQARMNSVLNFMQLIDNRSLSSIEFWTRYGDRISDGERNDDSPEWRAAEVHIFIGDQVPPPPPGPVKEWKRPKPPLPGGPRYSNWSIATPGGMVGTPLLVGPSGGTCKVVVKNDTGEVRKYWAIVFGGGISLTFPAGIVLTIFQTLATGWSYNAGSFTGVTSKHPITWEELESCLVSFAGSGAGYIKSGYSNFHVTFDCPRVYQYDSSGQPNHFAERVFEFDSEGESHQLGLSDNALAGPLKRSY